MGPYIALILLMAAIFGLCFLVDKGFTKLFRGKAQHMTGRSVRVNKRYGSLGLIVALLGIAGTFAGFGANWLLFAGGLVLILVGCGLVVYYMSFGIYYDDDSFIWSSFGKKSVTYRYRDIQAQQLYTSAAGILVELHLSDGRALQLQPSMKGVPCFIKAASQGWLTQMGKTAEECEFYDPDNSCWFPPAQ